MIKLRDIKKAVNNLLTEKFPTIPVKSQDIEKGFARPSFTTFIEEPKIETLESQIETSATIEIYYFPDLKENEKSLTTLDMQWELPMALGNKLKVLNRSLNVIEPSSEIVDGILVFEFNILFYQESENTKEQMAELMKELHIKLESE